MIVAIGGGFVEEVYRVGLEFELGEPEEEFSPSLNMVHIVALGNTATGSTMGV